MISVLSYSLVIFSTVLQDLTAYIKNNICYPVWYKLLGQDHILVWANTPVYVEGVKSVFKKLGQRFRNVGHLW